MKHIGCWTTATPFVDKTIRRSAHMTIYYCTDLSSTGNSLLAIGAFASLAWFPILRTTLPSASMIIIPRSHGVWRERLYLSFRQLTCLPSHTRLHRSPFYFELSFWREGWAFGSVGNGTFWERIFQAENVRFQEWPHGLFFSRKKFSRHFQLQFDLTLLCIQ